MSKSTDSIIENIERVLEKRKKQISSRELMRASGVRNKKRFYEALHLLCDAGKITVTKKHIVQAVAPHKLIAATIVSLSKSFAFAKPELPGEDIFIPGSYLKGAFLGDRVLLENVRMDAKGLSGRVSRIVEHASKQTTGTIIRNGPVISFNTDSKIRYDIPVIPSESMQAKNGDKVLAEIYSPAGRDQFFAKVCRIYGRGDSARVCADAILDRYDIPMEFPEEVLHEAEQVAAGRITEEDLKGRLDLRNLGIFTIDSADAKDLDDAISVSRTRDGYKLGVHIADVSHYVKAHGDIDKEALNRGTSVYFADRVVPMLPEALSNGVCSLNAGQDKLTFSAIIRLDKQGQILSYEFRKSVICSKVRGVYSEVNEIFSKTASPELRKKYSPVIRGLNAAKELAEILRENSRKRGTMELDSGESKFILDEQGVCVNVEPRVSGEAEELIEQMMITANQAAAKFAQEKMVPFIYRVHARPEQRKLDSLLQLLDALGISAKELRSGTPSTRDFAAVLERSRNTPAERILSHQILRTMEKAKYSTDPIGHFGLALKDYCHFTSPIRRYPDLAIHRILSEITQGKKWDEISRRFASFADLAAEESSRLEVRAMSAERDAEDCYMAEYMRAHLGEVFSGVISGVIQRGVFVQLTSSAEGFVPIEAFKDADFHFDGLITQYDGRSGRKLTIGTELNIKVAAADVASGRIDFLPAEEFTQD